MIFNPEIGDSQPDGTIYAGVSPDNFRPFYALPEDAPLAMSFNQAAEYALELNRRKLLGHDDWRVPSDSELDLLFQNRDKGSLKGTFNQNAYIKTGWYLSSTRLKHFGAYLHAQSFHDGERVWMACNKEGFVRCVRG